MAKHIIIFGHSPAVLAGLFISAATPPMVGGGPALDFNRLLAGLKETPENIRPPQAVRPAMDMRPFHQQVRVQPFRGPYPRNRLGRG